MENLTEQQAVLAFFSGVATLGPVIMIKLAMDFVRRGSGYLEIRD